MYCDSDKEMNPILVKNVLLVLFIAFYSTVCSWCMLQDKWNFRLHYTVTVISITCSETSSVSWFVM